MHRSGTSALTRTVSLLGCQLPRKLMQAADGNNDQGFWEPQDIYEFNEKLLKTLGSQWDDWRPLQPTWERQFDPASATHEQTDILRDNYQDAPTIVLKDPRMCRLYPAWAGPLSNSGYASAALLALRNPLEVAGSLAARDGFSTNRSLLLWLRHMLDAERHSRDMPRSIVPFSDLLTDWQSVATRVESQLQHPWPRRPQEVQTEIDAFLHPDNRHHAHGSEDIKAHPEVFNWVTQSFDALRSLVSVPMDEEALTTLDSVRAEFDDACRIFGPEWFQAESAQKSTRHQLEVAEYQKGKLKEKADDLDFRLQRTETARVRDREKQQRLEAAITTLKTEKHDTENRLADTTRELATTRDALKSTRGELQTSQKSLRAQQARARHLGTQLQKREAALQASSTAFQQAETRASADAQTTLATISAIRAQTKRPLPIGSRVKKVAFAARRSTPSQQQIHMLLATGLFDPAFYQAQYPDVAAAGCEPLLHWLKEGWQQGRSPSCWFDLPFYLAHNPDVAESGVNPLLHYLEHGWREHRSPHQLFDPDWYLRQAPDVAAAGQEPLGHFAQQGRRESRSPSPWLDRQWYAARHGISPEEAFAHYTLLARQFPTSPTPYFDAHWYLTQHPDVAAGSTPAFTHFLQHGAAEGRNPNPWFDSRWYRRRYPECGTNPLLHFLLRDDRAHVDPGPNFSCTAYRARYADVAGSGVDAFTHFLTRGQHESRDPTPAKATTPRRTTLPSAPAHSRASVAQELTAEQVAKAEQQLAGCSKRFSIILPTWNRRDTLVRAVESVIAQRYPHWELLICDDGSDDGSEQLIREQYEPAITSGQIRYLSLPHAGVSAARNAGLAAASGDWVAYLDSDNLWHPEYLLLTAQAFVQTPARTHYAGLAVRDDARQTEFVRCVAFDWPELLRQNFIDLNIFAHHRSVYLQLGGFDEDLTRLVDWDLILRFTRTYPPRFTPHVLADYFLAQSLNNITHREPLARNEERVRRKYAPTPVRGESELRLAYVLWDWPALSQTFVLEELHELKRRSIDVVVYFHSAPDRAATQAPDVPARQVADADELATLLAADQRNWVHSHFAYPAVTRLVWPAAEQAGIPFSFMPHAVDIFHHSNRERNQIAAVTQSAYCARVMVHGEYHRRFLADAGVPGPLFSFTPQAIDLAPLLQKCAPRGHDPESPLRVVVLARLIEKKGLSYLIDAVAQARSALTVDIYGYGPLQEELQAQVTARNLESQVRFHGSYEGTDVLADILNTADVCCLPCVEAENGDLDGMPTVLFEAMAAGVPVVSTTVAAIPEFITHGINGYLAPPRDSQALARCLDRLATLPTDEYLALARHARNTVQTQVGTMKTVDTLLDTACRPPLDIFMVTYHRDNYGNWAATERAIRSVLEHTTTPFRLTIVDNASDPAFVAQLQALAAGDSRIRILALAENIYCGPASNLALEMAESEFAIYVCSNEGLILKRGWERQVLTSMREHPNAALGGQRAYSPRWYNGATYAAQPWISSFRNSDYASANPERAFWHVQGGLFAIRMEVFRQHGGFSPERPQDLMDVELSFYYESLGYALIDIPGIVALSNKTRPTIAAQVDETTIAVHPVFENELPMLEICRSGAGRRCNLCNWMEAQPTAEAADAIEFTCPACGSSPGDRATYRTLSRSNLHHRGLAINPVHLGTQASEQLRDMFVFSATTPDVCEEVASSQSASRVLGIAPGTSHHTAPHSNDSAKPAQAMRCNICGGSSFGPGPNGRTAVDSSAAPRCNGCQSLERHRAFRQAFADIGDAFCRGKTALQFSEDKAVPAEWFAQHEVSVFGGTNSLDLQDIDRPDASYDIVICNHVIEHVPDDGAALKELARIVRPDGFVFLSFPDPVRQKHTQDWGFPREDQHGHFRVYGRDVFAKLKSALPHMLILAAHTQDPATGTGEMYFLIGSEPKLMNKLAARAKETIWVQSQ